MSNSWERRSAATSSDSSSLGGLSLADFSFLGSFDGGAPFTPNNSLLNHKPATKLLPLARSARSFRHSNNLFTDSNSFFYNGGSVTGNDDSFNSSITDSSFVGNFQSSVRSTRLLPSWTVDTTGAIRSDLTLHDVVRNGLLIDFALDRQGVKFLEEKYPREATDEMHAVIFDKLTEAKFTFPGLCRSAAGNFIVQKLVEYATHEEQKRLVTAIAGAGLEQMCTDKFACRVIQLAIQKFESSIVSVLVSLISHLDFVRICTDQCAIHVLQRIVKNLPVSMWTFFVESLCREDNLMAVCQDKYGCRLVQQAIDKLAENPKSPCFSSRIQLLHQLMTSVARNCYRLSSNEFANYVVQYVVKSSGVMEMYRDTIIEKCLLRNLLSMSQDKYASHVVEGAFLFAPPVLLKEMMEEIFDGYVKDHDSNRDALDILLFHQYGNYVVQQMISICTSALMGKEERQLSAVELSAYGKWYDVIKTRVIQHGPRLERFSSGKKIIDSVMKVPLVMPLPPTQAPTPSFLELTNQMDSMQLDALWLNSQSFLSNSLIF